VECAEGIYAYLNDEPMGCNHPYHMHPHKYDSGKEGDEVTFDDEGFSISLRRSLDKTRRGTQYTVQVRRLER
jgi:hypothetical protein